MSSRNIIQYLIITAKGLAMGAADVVPGVSGGTIAFISGIYEELIETIHKLDIGFLSTWKEDGFFKAWKDYNIGFLVALFSGIGISILSLAKVITWLLSNHPIMVWSFFFGLVLASIIYVGRQINKWCIKAIGATIIATGLSYAITLARPIEDINSTWFLFLAGFIAIIAMILPGISGAFILLLLGAYKSIMATINQFRDGILSLDWELFSSAFFKISIFAMGAIFGLKVFSRALNWLFKNHKDLILATLTGFMIGALNKIWPWKQVLEYRMNHSGETVPFIEKSVFPGRYAGEPLIWYALLLMLFGFLSIFILEKIATQKKSL